MRETKHGGASADRDDRAAEQAIGKQTFVEQLDAHAPHAPVAPADAVAPHATVTASDRAAPSLVHAPPTAHLGPIGTGTPPSRVLPHLQLKNIPAQATAPSAGAQPGGMWDHTFGEASTSVGKLARIQAPRGVYLRTRPLPGAASSHPPIPFNGLVHVERRTTQPHSSERWCYVIAADAGAAGFCEERYLALDPPEPTATLRRTAAGERLALIAEEAYGPPTGQNNSRLYVQALYLANRDRAGVTLDHVDLGFRARATRGDAEEQTLQIYQGAKIITGTSLWIPSKPFIEQLEASGAITSGSTHLTQAWDTAKDAVGTAVDATRYAAGVMVGVLEGAYGAIIDLFKGAADMLQAVLEVVWHLVTGNPGLIKDMVITWADKMKQAWERRGDIADEFLKKWNAESPWDRGRFQGEVLGWVMMTVLLILLTLGQGTPAALSGVTLRWPQLIHLLKTVDTLGDVTTYLGVAAKALKLPGTAAAHLAGKLGKAGRSATNGDAPRAVTEREHSPDNASGHEKPSEPSARHPSAERTVSVHGLAQTPKTYPWNKNPAGVVRTVSDVKRIALEHGVEIPHDIQIFAVDAKWLPPDSYAQYLGRDFVPGRRAGWEEFYNRYESIAVKISKEILDSDEAIVAVIAHEMHELNGLRKLFNQRETIPVEELGRLINPGHKGNLHDQAWTVADQLVVKMRRGSHQ